MIWMHSSETCADIKDLFIRCFTRRCCVFALYISPYAGKKNVIANSNMVVCLSLCNVEVDGSNAELLQGSVVSCDNIPAKLQQIPVNQPLFDRWKLHQFAFGKCLRV